MTSPPSRRKGPLEKALGVFADVRPGESARVLLLMTNIFLILASYYVIKTAREAIIISTGGAELKAYAGGAQAAVLVAYVPLYGWVATRTRRLGLLVVSTLFFVAAFELFYFAAIARVPRLGFFFYVFVGIFSVSIIAQFWSYANDLYSRVDGERLFPLVAVGMTLGSPVGSYLAARLFDAGVSGFSMLHVSSAMLLAHLGLYGLIERGGDKAERPPVEPLERGNGFALVLASPYLRLVALLLILLNLVNTTGEYILAKAAAGAALDAAAVQGITDPAALKAFVERFMGSFYGRFYTIVNLATVAIQALLVSRIVRYLGIAGVLLALPVVAFGAYGLIAAGAGLAMIRWAKTAENSTDYSVMNTAKAMLWLPTSRAEKYAGKQAVDTFFVRFGDLLSAGLVFVGSAWLGLGPTGFAGVNLVLVLAWASVAVLVLREHRRLTATQAAAASDLAV